MKLIVFKKSAAPLLALVLALGMAGYAAAYPDALGAYATDRALPIYCVDRGAQKICAISFDAAWGNEDTQQLIDILDRYEVKTTFFVVGDWVEKYPESVKALFDAGHEVMSHSDHHDHYNSLTTEQIAADLKACNEKIAAVTGVTPTLIRCPYGEYDDHVVNAVRGYGMEPIQWDVEPSAPAARMDAAAAGKPRQKPRELALLGLLPRMEDGNRQIVRSSRKTRRRGSRTAKPEARPPRPESA